MRGKLSTFLLALAHLCAVLTAAQAPVELKPLAARLGYPADAKRLTTSSAQTLRCVPSAGPGSMRT